MDMEQQFKWPFDWRRQRWRLTMAARMTLFLFGVVIERTMQRHGRLVCTGIVDTRPLGECCDMRQSSLVFLHQSQGWPYGMEQVRKKQKERIERERRRRR